MDPAFASDEDRLRFEAFFADRPRARLLWSQLATLVAEISAGACSVVATKSRVAFLGRTRFCWVHEATRDGIWVGFHHPAPLDDPRLRSGQAGAKWSHHLKITGAHEMDLSFQDWIAGSWAAFGAP